MRRLIAVSTLALSLTACGSSEPEGLYIMSRFWVATSSLELGSYRFDDGIVVHNPISPSGDVDEERAAHPKDVGTFEVDGDEMVMTFDGREQRSEMEWDGDCFMWETGTFCPVEPIDDETIEGTYTGGSSSRAGGGLAMSASTVKFNEDGTYEMGSAASISSSNDGSAVSAGSSGNEKGEYRFDGTTLYMTPEGGEERVISTFEFDDGTDGEKPRRIYFGGSMLKRVD